MRLKGFILLDIEFEHVHHTVSTDSRETAAGLVPRQPLDGATVESALCHSMSILSVPHHHVAVLCGHN